MKPNWDQIVDYARGIGTDQAKGSVEADPEALALARSLSSLAPALQQQAPDSYINRAKALLPQQPVPRKIWQGILTFESSGLQPGFRSGEALARDLTFEFGEAACSIRIEPIPQSERVSIAGVFAVEGSEHVRVKAERADEVWCDDSGQFVLEAGDSVSQISLIHAFTGEEYILNLR